MSTRNFVSLVLCLYRKRWTGLKPQALLHHRIKANHRRLAIFLHRKNKLQQCNSHSKCLVTFRPLSHPFNSSNNNRNHRKTTISPTYWASTMLLLNLSYNKTMFGNSRNNSSLLHFQAVRIIRPPTILSNHRKCL